MNNLVLNRQIDSIEQLNQEQLAQYVINAFRLTILHYGLWFNEVMHQLGMEETFRTEGKVFATAFPIIIKRLSKTLGYDDGDVLSHVFYNMPQEKLLNLANAMAVNWLAADGVWFQAVESNQDMYTSKRCNDTCWTRFSPLEASMIRSFLEIPEHGSGLDGLAKALNFRLYARINKQTIEKHDRELIFKMITCRVQVARKSKGLDDYPCKSAGLVEYETFARTIDPRIKTECIACPPDKHPEEWTCAWRFYID
jgi:hypothetical protein